jgi:dipeptidyl-peptidase-4
MNTRTVQIIRLFALLAMLLSAVVAQEKKKITLETMNDPSLSRAMNTPRFWWFDDNTAAVYDTRKPAAERTLDRWDPVTGKRTTMYDLAKASESLKQYFPDGKTPTLPPIPNGVTGNGSRGYYLLNGDVYVVELSTGAILRVTNTPEEEKSVNFSPDGRKIAFVRKNDLYAYDIDQKQEWRLTNDGSQTVLNGTLSWVYWEEIFGRRDIGYWWSNDSKSVAFLRSDESGVSVQNFVDFEPWTPTVQTQRYPKVGQKNPDVKVGIADLGSAAAARWIAIDPASYEYIMRVDWMPDNKRLCVRTLNRIQTDLSFWFVDRAGGTSTFIMKDSDPGWINMTDDLYFLKDGKYFITSSERDGYTHLYRFTMDGKLVNQVTKGDWSIHSSGGGVFWIQKAVSGIDEDNGWVYFTGQEKQFQEKHLYRIKMDGSKMKRLTEGDGVHAITMSPNCKFYFDRYSNVTTPPSLKLFTADGKEKTVIAASDLAGFKDFDVQFEEHFTIPARDGFQIPVSLVKPKNLEPGKKYPVIVFVYGGPSAPTISNSFSGNLWENMLLNEGFLYAKIDNRAATAISKKLENMLHLQSPGPVELNDLIDGVRALKKLPYIDGDRFGITGFSGGGTNTLLAMTQSTEFKAGIAGGAVTDFRFYDSKWGEALMQTEKENKENFDKYSLLKYAKDLHGKLMLVHGTHDDNVHIQNMWRFVDELIKANKLFELAIYPNRHHGVGGRQYQLTQIDFWKRNLLN